MQTAIEVRTAVPTGIIWKAAKTWIIDTVDGNIMAWKKKNTKPGRNIRAVLHSCWYTKAANDGVLLRGQTQVYLYSSRWEIGTGKWKSQSILWN